MASRYEVEVTIISAKNLKNVNWRHGPIKPYAVVWVNPNNKCSTKIDEDGDTCPYWDHTLLVPLSGPVDEYTTLYVDVVHCGNLEDTKPLIGSAWLKLIEILGEVGYGDTTKRGLTLKRPSGRPQGKVDVKVKLRNDEPRYRDAYYPPSYGVPPPSSYGSGYSAPPASPSPYPPEARALPPLSSPYYPSEAPSTGYPYGGQAAQAQPYGQAQVYGQPSYGFGGKPPAQEEKKKSKFGGMGMGTGLAVGAAAGLIGGYALHEGIDKLHDKAVDDVADRVQENLGLDDDEE